MRIAAILLIIVCLAAAGFTGYLYLTAQVTVSDIDCIAADAADQEEAFDLLKAQTEAGIFTGTPFDLGEIGDAQDYQFFTYTVQLRNGTFIQAEMAEFQITPMNGDVLQLEETQSKHISARSFGTIQGTILTKKGMHNVREINISYYLWGLPFALRTTYSK